MHSTAIKGSDTTTEKETIITTKEIYVGKKPIWKSQRYYNLYRIHNGGHDWLKWLENLMHKRNKN